MQVAEAAPASQVVTLAADELEDEEAYVASGPDMEVQQALAEELAAAERDKYQAEAAAQSEAAARQNLVNYALQFVGGPYRAGGNDPHTGADCSGFVKYVMQNGAGITMNRSSSAQASQGRTVDASQMQPGDLVLLRQRLPGEPRSDVHRQWTDRPCVHLQDRDQDLQLELPDAVRIASMF